MEDLQQEANARKNMVRLRS